MSDRSLRRARPRWRPTPFLQLSIAGHAVAAGALLCRPSLQSLVIVGGVANHLMLIASGLWPRSSVLGSNWTRLPQSAAAAGSVALTLDDGPDPAVTPRVLDVLDRHHAKASFFCIGDRAQRYPDLVREIRRRGHAVENHSQRHTHRFSVMGPRAMANEIIRAQDVLGSITGEAPRFFRAPAGLRNPFLDPILTHAGLQLASWTRRGFDTVAREPEIVSARLLRGLSAGDILLLHDGDAALTRRGQPIVLEVLPALLQAISAAGLKTVTLRGALQRATASVPLHTANSGARQLRPSDPGITHR
jgi:peptidoglycan/xylan/chitin deacetylase (PgdA/CDA1 family)